MISMLYLLLFVALVVFSWVANIYGLTLPSGSLVPSLFSEESVRWFVRHGVDNVSAAPLGQVLLVLLAMGALRSSGLMTSLRKGAILDQRQRHARRVSLIVCSICILFVVLGILPGGNLLGVTGHITGGPFAAGWLFISSLIVVLSSIVYGVMCEHWHFGADLFTDIAVGMGVYSNYFFVLVVASQLVAAVGYVQLFDLLRMSPVAQNILVSLVYVLPLVLLIIKNEFLYESSAT